MNYERDLIEMRPLAKDPSNSERLWGVGTKFGDVGYSDHDGDAFVGKTANPSSIPSAGIQQLTFSSAFAWLLTSVATGSRQGWLYRSPLPDADGNGLDWGTTPVFSLADAPDASGSPVGGGEHSTFRNSSAAIAEPNIYLLEYSSATMGGGPSLYWSGDNGQHWKLAHTWPNARHGHAVKVIGGVPWVMLGDLGAQFTDIGLWAATDVTGALWSRKSIYGDNDGGRYLTGINFFPILIDGYEMIVAESDTHHGIGPLLYPSADKDSSMAFIPLCSLPPPYIGTMFSLTLTSDGKLLWVTTGENGSVGPVDSVWIADPPFRAPELLEAVPLGTFGTLGDPVEQGSFVFFGTYRIGR